MSTNCMHPECRNIYECEKTDSARRQILNSYTINGYGIIQDSGKFQAEMLYAPHFYEFASDGEELSGMEDGEYMSLISVDDEDRVEFPELGAALYVLLIESDSGFVSCKTIDSEKLAERIRLDYEPEDEDEDEDS